MRTKTIVATERKSVMQQIDALRKISRSDASDELTQSFEKKLIDLDAELEEIANNKKSAAEMQREEKAKAKKAKAQEEKGEETDESKWQAFKSALAAYNQYNFCFHRDTTPRYFLKANYVDIDKGTEQERKTSELHFYPAASMGMNFVELSSPASQRYLRLIVEGKDIKIMNPETKVEEIFGFDRKVYTKLGNMRHIPDAAIYNMVDLSNIMTPDSRSDNDPVPECPPVMKALLVAMSGSELIANPVTGDLIGTKQKTIEWLERWIYAITCADIGNNFLPMPVQYGKGKKGKNALYDYVIPGMLGKELCFTAIWDVIDGNFNSFKIGKVFMYIDEVPSREDWNKIKNMTGSPDDYVKVKYGPEFQIDNTISWAMGTNQMTFPLPLEDGKQMMRVSPISLVKGLTFAEATYEIMNAMQPGFVDQALDALGIDKDHYPTTFDKGDTFLRSCPQLWRERAVLQEFMNYLHYKHAPKEGCRFALEPLRDVDWADLQIAKQSPISKTVEYIVERNVKEISIYEVLEIYKICAGDSKSDQFIKQKNNLVSEITPMLEAHGYSMIPRKRIGITGGASMSAKTGKTIEGQLWYKGIASPYGYKTCYDEYIVEHSMPGGKTVRGLIYPD